MQFSFGGGGLGPLFLNFLDPSLGVVSWRIISTCFLGAINLQGKEKSCSLLKLFFYFLKRVEPAIIF